MSWPVTAFFHQRTAHRALHAARILSECLLNPLPDLLAHVPKGGTTVAVCYYRQERISKGVMKIRSTRKDGAVLLGISAHGNNVVKGCVVKHIQRLCSVCGNIDTHFSHYRNCAPMYLGGFTSRAVRFISIAIPRVYEPFGHLRSCCVVRAEEQYFLHAHFLNVFSEVLT